MTEKKGAAEFIEALMDGKSIDIQAIPTEDVQSHLRDVLEEQYEFTDAEFHEALLLARPKLEEMIGVQLSDEQLLDLAGGKSKKEFGTSAGVIAAGTTVTVSVLAIAASIAIYAAIK